MALNKFIEHRQFSLSSINSWQDSEKDSRGARNAGGRRISASQLTQYWSSSEERAELDEAFQLRSLEQPSDRVEETPEPHGSRRLTRSGRGVSDCSADANPAPARRANVGRAMSRRKAKPTDSDSATARRAASKLDKGATYEGPSASSALQTRLRLHHHSALQPLLTKHPPAPVDRRQPSPCRS